MRLSVIKMALATFCSRILGLVREQALAAVFGASGLTDAFTVAYRIPNLLRDLFAEGAFSSAFVPIFTEARMRDEQSARRLFWSMAIVLFVLTGAISVFMIIKAEWLVLVATDSLFAEDAERLALAISLLKVMAPFLTLISLAAITMGALNALKVFFLPSFAPVFFNVAMILSIIFVPPYAREWGFHPMMALGWGVIVGGLLQWLIQVPTLLKKGFAPTKELSLWNKDVSRILGRLGIGTVGIAATQINVLISTILATGTMVGAVSWLTYAFRLFQFPVGILGVSVAGSNLVHFSDDWKSGLKDKAIGTLKMSYVLSLVLIVPALALMLALRDETVVLVFERGAFSSLDSARTSVALLAYLVGLPFYGLYKIFAPVFFTLDRPKVPVTISICSIALNIIFCLILTPIYGYPVLALGTSLSMAFNVAVQAFMLHRLLGIGFQFFVSLRILKIFLAGAGCFALAEYVSRFVIFSQLGLGMKIASFVLSCTCGGLLYLALLWVFGERVLFSRLLSRSKS